MEPRLRLIIEMAVYKCPPHSRVERALDVMYTKMTIIPIQRAFRKLIR